MLGAGEQRGGAAADADYVLLGGYTTGNGQPVVPPRVLRFDTGTGAWVQEATPALAAIGVASARALDLDAAGRVLAVVAVGPTDPAVRDQTLRVVRRDAPGVWTEVATADVAAPASSGRVWGVWGGRAIVGAPTYASNGSNSGGAWVVDLRPVLPVAGEAAPGGALLSLSPPSPNPSRGAARLTLTVAEAGAVRVSVVDVLGREVAVVLDEAAAPGEQVLGVDAAAWPAGVYVVRATAGAQTATARLVVAR